VFLVCLSVFCVLCMVLSNTYRVSCLFICVLCLVYGVVQHISCFLFVYLCCVSCVWCCPTHIVFLVCLSVLCVLCMVLSTTSCVLFLFCLYFVLCTQCCQFLWIVHLVISPSVFSNVYFHVYSGYYIYTIIVLMKS
jgi:hypothetical protein